MSFLFSNLSTYISHIPENNSGIYLTKGSGEIEYFTCGKHINKQQILSKLKKNLKCGKCSHRTVNDDIYEQIIFTNLSVYIEHIPEETTGIYITKGSHKKEIFTDGSNFLLQEIKSKIKRNNGYRTIENRNLINSSVLFTSMSNYIEHIPEISSGIYLTKGVNFVESFTCGQHINSQSINNKIDQLGNCGKCINQKLDNSNILSCLLFTNLSSFIGHIPENTSGIYITNGSNEKEQFTCGEHINIQAVISKTSGRNCKRCSVKMVDNENIFSSILFTSLSIFISLIPENNIGIYLSKGSNKKQMFTCGKHTNLQTVNTKAGVDKKGCKDCVIYHSEKCCREIIEELTEYKFSKNKNIDWLVNPETNRKLEIDCCNMDLKLGFEYNDHISKYHKQTDIQFKEQQERDLIKQQLCKENNFLLLYVPVKYTYKNKVDMREFMKQLLIENGKEYLIKH